MYLRVSFFYLLFAVLSLNAQTAINLHGKVSNLAGKPIANAILTLVQQGLKDTSGADGAYLISNQTAVVPPVALIPQRQTIVLENGFLAFSLPDNSPVKVQIYDVRGKLLKKEILPNASRGFYRFNIEENARASKVLIIKTSIDQDEFTFRYLPLHGCKYVINQSQKDLTEVNSKLAKLTAISDTLKVTAAGYTAKSVAVASYDQELNITLDTAGDKGVKPSSGCGKAAAFKGETQVTINVTAAGTGNRMYYLRIPDDYDQNHPYSLWFTPHCMNGSAENVAHSEPDTRARYEYLGMWRCANPVGKGTTIFCAPQGINAGWGQGQKDLEFFRAMIKKFESELCIDESRIFSSGFSMGGSMSYALACAMPDTFRAIAMHEGGSMSGCDQAHRGPVPAVITVGTEDNWPNMGIPQLADLAKRDGCTAIDIPAMVASGQIKPPDQMHPVCVEYKNCDAGYPCKAYIFKGGHIGSPGTLGSYGKNDTWVPDSTWKFMKQFY